MIPKILALLPWLEVLIRNVYWRCKWLNRIAERMLASRKRLQSAKIASPLEGSTSEFIATIKRMGVSNGDILIVHSNFSALKRFGLSPREMIDLLLAVIGPEGTLVMPAIPVFAEAPAAIDRFDDAAYAKPFIYDLRKARIWTGILAQTMIKMPGSVRSRHPLNSVVAFGKHATAMLANELDSMDKLPCGEGTSWAYCYRHNAKILMLGVDTVHSLTMIHVAEDLFPESWPIKKWYRRRQFRIIDENSEQLIDVLERRPEWALYYAERRFSRDLFAHGIVRGDSCDGVDMTITESAQLVDFLNSRKSSGYPYFIPFWLK